jgi:hypothetical protein
VNAIETAIDRIKTVGDIGKEQGRIMFKQAEKSMTQHFVRTVADKHVFVRKIEMGCDGIFQQVRIGVGIQSQTFACVAQLGLNGGHDPG